MNELDYRSANSYANSDLSELLRIRRGEPTHLNVKPETLQFGTTFHSMALEPDLSIDWSRHHVTERYTMMQMAESYRAQMPGYVFSAVEQAVFWTDPVTGLPCKGRIDAVTQRHDGQTMLIDLKTTMCKSPNEFYDTFVKYGYDRQAAYYVDGYATAYSVPPPRFVFVGVQKAKPFGVYIIDMMQSEGRRQVVENGRVKNRRLLADAKATGWVPSSWSRQPEMI